MPARALALGTFGTLVVKGRMGLMRQHGRSGEASRVAALDW